MVGSRFGILAGQAVAVIGAIGFGGVRGGRSQVVLVSLLRGDPDLAFRPRDVPNPCLPAVP